MPQAIRHTSTSHASLLQVQWRDFVDALPVAVHVCAKDGTITYFNRKAAEFWGREPRLGDSQERYCGALRLRTSGGQTLPHDQTPMADVLATGQPVRDQEVVIERPDGTRITALVNIAPLHNDKGDLDGAINCFQDISDRLRTQAELSQHQHHLEELVAERTRALEDSHAKLRLSERMAALGTLSAGLGHDMGNLLLPMRLRLDTIESKGLPAELHEDFDAIRKCAEYLQRLSNGLRLFALDPDDERASRSGGEQVDLKDWWADVESFLRNALPKGVELSKRFDEPLPPVRLARHQLTQAVFNLVQNAGDALRERGFGNVALWAQPSADGANVRLGVTDDGPGMSAEVKLRCTEPFFTTKTRGISTGLGLALVHGVVLKCGGKLEVHSEPGKGSTFIMSLPAGVMVDHAATDKGEPLVARVVLSNTRIQAYVISVLRSMGFHVTGPDSQEPAALWVADQRAIDRKIIDAHLENSAHRLVLMGDFTDSDVPASPSIICLQAPAKPALIWQTLADCAAAIQQ